MNLRLLKPRYADGQTVEVQGLAVRLRVSPRARRVSLKVDRLAREAIAVAPSAGRLAEAADFARSRHAWLAARLAELPALEDHLVAGDELEVFGTPWRLSPDGRRPRLLDPQGVEQARVLTGCGAGSVDPQLVIRAIRREAQSVFPSLAAGHCRSLGVPAPPISVMDARTRWGSCTPAHGRQAASIRLSWRLSLAPLPVADYVVAHECAHLLEANHGPRFWALVRNLVGEERRHRAWLRAHGARLHAILPNSPAP